MQFWVLTVQMDAILLPYFSKMFLCLYALCVLQISMSAASITGAVSMAVWTHRAVTSVDVLLVRNSTGTRKIVLVSLGIFYILLYRQIFQPSCLHLYTCMCVFGVSMVTIPGWPSEAVTCLPNGKPAPRALLSCTKTAGVETCSLSCPSNALFQAGQCLSSVDVASHYGWEVWDYLIFTSEFVGK